jgi:CHAT domain-containing protein
LSESKPQRKGKPAVLAIGDPVFSLAQANTAVVRPTDSRIDDVMLRSAVNHDPTALDKLPRLPYTGRELDRMQALFPDSRVIRGRDASEVAVDSMVAANELQHFDIVHVASHALVDPAPERCAIALSRLNVDGSVSNDGLIDTPEMRMGWKLDAELVTLSACQTAGVGFNRGEPVGFAQALFQAGARCVLLSFWKVDDEATSLLMSRFYENVAAYGKQGKPVSYSESLQDAKNWVRNYTDKAGRHPFAHPVYWSGFVLIGDAN